MNRILPVLAIALGVACGPRSGADSGLAEEPRGERLETACGLGPRHWTAWATTDDEGRVEIPIELFEGETGFDVEVLPLDPISNAGITAVSDPEGTRVWGFEWGVDAPPWFEFPMTQTMISTHPLWASYASFAWPWQEGASRASGTWTVDAVTVHLYTKAAVPAIPVQVDVYVKRDDDTDQGCIPVLVVPASGDEAFVEPLVEAVDLAAAWWEAQGIRWEVEVLEEQGGAEGGWGDNFELEVPLLEQLGAEHPGQVVLLSTEDIFSSTLLGYTGQGPGMPRAAQNAGIVLIPLLHAGVDGAFSDEELDYFGLTIAHEMGHWLGLPHPVDFDSGLDDYPVFMVDNFEGTSECDAYTAGCSAALGSNMMYPFVSDKLDEVELLPEQQRLVLDAGSAY